MSARAMACVLLGDSDGHVSRYAPEHASSHNNLATLLTGEVTIVSVTWLVLDNTGS